MGSRFRTLWATAALAGSLGPVHSDELHSYLERGEAGATLTVSPCTGEDVVECVSHSLSCERNEFTFTAIAGNVQLIAMTLMTSINGGNWDENWHPRGTLLLSGGADRVSLDIHSMHLLINELDGGWMLTIDMWNSDHVLDSLTADNTEGAAIELAGETFPLASERGDGAKLMDFRSACQE